MLFPLYGGVAGLAVEIVKVLDLDEVVSSGGDALKQVNDLGMGDGRAAIMSHEAAAPVVGGEGFGHTFRPHFRAAIGNHRQFQPVAANPLEGFTQLIGGAAVPVQEDIHPHQVLLLVGGCAGDGRVGRVPGRAGVADGLQYFWRLSQAGDHRVSKLARANFLLADAIMVDIVGMHAVFDGAQPGVVDACRDIRLVDVNQHHDRAKQQTRWIGQVLSRAPGSGAMNGLEHGAAVADIGRACQPDRTSHLRCNVRQDVAVQVGQHDYIESFRRIGKLGRTDVHNPGFVFDVWVVAGDLVEDFVKQAIRQLHDVVLHEAGYFFAIVAARVFKGVAHDLFAAGAADKFETFHHVVGLAVLDARVEVLFIFTHDDHIHRRMFGLDKWIIGDARTHVGVQSEHNARCDVQALVPAALGRGNGSLEKYLGAAQGLPRARLDARADAPQIDLLADFDLFNIYTRACSLDNAQGGVHNFWPDAISSCYSYRNVIRHSNTLSSFDVTFFCCFSLA